MNKTNYHKYYYLLYKLRNSPTLCIVDESVYKKDLFERIKHFYSDKEVLLYHFKKIFNGLY